MINQTVASLARTAIPGVRRHIIYARHLRPFSTTPRDRSIGDISAFTAAFQKTTVFKKLANHPEAINAIRALMGIMQEAGIDVTSGAQPSTFKMAKLMMNSKFREQVTVVAEEMKKANVDLNSKEVMDEIMALRKAAEPPK
ncbi:hypothetical protein E4T56_gene3585 [Termitomyces sp. T112]|nr:hypothetical protein C0989_007208 [Termitomyces sp. Mn162]KAG5733047.1 hypothetical protein E4T56_gene3585 [Termitomyces sp. T112]KAH0587370.1 hypothetical protein H2248_006167 [Termitomyces sp. 'cryptogamus']KNZ74434.1 hypothetical protein J132_06946 [Termitomyces sp. J132]